MSKMRDEFVISINRSIATIVKGGQPLRAALVKVIRGHWQSNEKLNAWIATSPKELVSWFYKLWFLVWNYYRRMLDVKEKVNDYNLKNPKEQIWPRACDQAKNIDIWAAGMNREKELNANKVPNPDIGFKLGVEWCREIADNPTDYSLVIGGNLPTYCKKLLKLDWWKRFFKRLDSLKDLDKITSWLGHCAVPDILFDINDEDEC